MGDSSIERPVAGHIAWSFALRKHAHDLRHYRSITAEDPEPPNGDQWFGASLLAVPVVAVWPLAIAYTLLGRSYPVGAERKGLLMEQKRRLAQLERELGL